MDRNPWIPLNPELWNFALEILRKNTPLSLLCSECTVWAEKKWLGLVSDKHSRYQLTTHDTSSLYHSISCEHGIHQRTAAEENLDKWFCMEKPQPPSPLLTMSCLHYQAHEKPKTDRFKIILSTPEMHIRKMTLHLIGLKHLIPADFWAWTLFCLIWAYDGPFVWFNQTFKTSASLRQFKIGLRTARHSPLNLPFETEARELVTM